jgi:hypothetical protein
MPRSGFAVARYKPDGTLDDTFGTAGTTVTAIGLYYDPAAAIFIQPDGKVLMGATRSGGGGSDEYDRFAIVRYLGTPCGNQSLDPGEECEDGACCTSECAIAQAGVVCRPAAGPCDIEERCSGETANCPADGFLPDATHCGDGSFCNGGETCQGGVCTQGSSPCAAGTCDEQSRTCLPLSSTTTSRTSSTVRTSTTTTTIVSPPDDGLGDDDRCIRRGAPRRVLSTTRCRLSVAKHRLEAAGAEHIKEPTRRRLERLPRSLRNDLCKRPPSQTAVRRADRTLQRLHRAVERATATGRMSAALSESLRRVLQGVATDIVRLAA